MKFPGQRKSKHYFPTDNRDPLINQMKQAPKLYRPIVVGVGQTIVDIEARVDDGVCGLSHRDGLRPVLSFLMGAEGAGFGWNQWV